MIRKLGWPLLVALVFLALSIRAASLVDASPLDKYKPQSAEGRRYYKLGAKFIALKKFKLAVQAYKDGYLADDAPIFLYNIATTYRAAGQLQESIDYCKRASTTTSAFSCSRAIPTPRSRAGSTS